MSATVGGDLLPVRRRSSMRVIMASDSSSPMMINKAIVTLINKLAENRAHDELRFTTA